MTRHVSDADSPWLDWHGLGGWNIYFLAKFALLWAGYLNFHPLINLVFAAFLIFPLPRAGLRRIRHWLALPVGMGIFYHDTWLPGIESIRAQGGAGLLLHPGLLAGAARALHQLGDGRRRFRDADPVSVHRPVAALHSLDPACPALVMALSPGG